MEKMIGVINNSLRNIINGIKTHKADAEKSLAVIKADMDDKVTIAAQYKVNVEDARTIIASLENEISDLENDLKELNEKFGSKNFKEILAAGNKEINTKIIEKRASISQQNQRILELTEKAHALKDDLVRLKQRKATTEDALNKSLILEKYYEVRINEIIKYSEENPGGLYDYVSQVEDDNRDVTELVYDNYEAEEIAVDGSIFEEIDEISTIELDVETLNAVIEDIQDDKDEEVETLEDTPGYVDLTMTQQLDDIILAANKVIENEKKNVEKTPVINNEEEKQVEVVKIEEEPKVEVNVEETEEAPKVIDEGEESGEFILVPLEDNGEELVEAPEITDDEPIIIEENLDDTTNVEHIIVEDDLEYPEIDASELFVDKPEVINNQEKEKEVVVPPENDKPLNVTSNVFNESVFASTNFYDLLSECNLDHDRFSEEDLVKLESKFNKELIVEFVNVLKKHNVAISKIYDNVDVMLDVTPQNMDYILTLLTKTGASNDAIGYVFNKLNKVNINSLEVAVNNNANRELTELLFDAIPYDGESNLINDLGLNAKEEADLRRYSTVEEFKMMNLFPEVVLANYNTLKGLRINNLNDCITKHPHRFIFNPDNFNAILDKYDTDDLIRCINKNSAVIDKL